jgi:phospholipid-binding lipoprotein MlaA
MFGTSLRKTLVAVAMMAGLAGCATPPPADDPEAVAEFEQNNDPLEPMNRFVFDSNDKIYRNFLHPIGTGYREAVPPFGREMISNMLANLKSPSVFLNDVLQGNFSRAGQVLVRLVLNSTFGVGGMQDVATPLGVPRHAADFGQTLAVWGIGEGPYLVIPVVGPSNPRDVTGLLVDSFTDPLDDYLRSAGMNWVSETRFGISVVALVEANMDAIDDVRRSSLDYYSAMRSLMRQRRQAEISEAANPSIGWFHLMPHMNINFQSLF